MSPTPLPAGIQGLVVQRLRDIPAGQVTATAKRAGLPLTVILRLRRGQATDVKLSTLERIAKGLQVSPAAVITAPDDGDYVPAVEAAPTIDPRVARVFISKLRAAATAGEKLVAQFVRRGSRAAKRKA